jgi:hypothetical protein
MSNTDLILPGNPFKKNKKEPNKSSEVIFEKEDIDYNGNIQYNKAITDFNPYFDNFKVKDNHAIIRVFKQEEDQKTDSGIILNNDVEWYETPGGQMKVRQSQNFYQTKAVIVKTGYLGDSEFYSELTPKTIVRLSTNKLGPEFDTSPETKGIIKEGYFLVHVGIIVGIEQ